MEDESIDVQHCAWSRSTRLETRTKEFNVRASINGNKTP